MASARVSSAPVRASKLSQAQLTPWADGKEARLGKQIPLKPLDFNILLYLIFPEIFDPLKTYWEILLNFMA